MLVEVKVPVLAESVAEATLLSWHKNIGDSVRRGDSLIDIETDKVTLEVAAPNNGTITEILKQDGDDVKSDEVIARIETEVSKAESAAKPAPAPAKPVSDSRPEVAHTQKTAEKNETTANPQQHSMPGMESLAATYASPRLSPAVRNLLQEHELQAQDIETDDPDGRITKEDVLNHLKKTGQSADKPTVAESYAAEKSTQTKTATADTTSVSETKVKDQPTSTMSATAFATSEDYDDSSVPAAMMQAPQSTGGGNRSEKKVAMTRLRKRVAERLLMAQRENAILTTFNEVNMQPVIELRNRYREEFQETHGVKLGLMSFFTKATVEALKKFPLINASVEGSDIIYHGYYDIGIAVSSPRGLVVPIIRDADTLSFARIESTIRSFGEKANDGSLTMEDLTGGTFTITNGGVFGSLLSTPIINPPQSAILGMHKMQDRPVAENGQVVIRPIMYLALSYDHRIIDGREAVQFLVAIKEQIEEPTRLLLQV